MDERIHLRHDDGYPAGFTLIDNRDIWTTCDRDRELLLRPATLGVYVAMRSLPNGWEFREPWLIKHLGLGRDALRRTIRDLEDCGRLVRAVQRDEKGRYLRTVWTLHRAGSPLTAFPSTEKPTAGRSRRRQNRTRVIKEEALSKETTTTASSRPLAAPQDALAWPRALHPKEVVAVGSLISCLKEEQQQEILDEIQGAYNRGTPPDTLSGWTFSLVEGAKDGGFTPNLGLPVRKAREKAAEEAAEAAARMELARELARPKAPAELERRQRILEELNVGELAASLRC